MEDQGYSTTQRNDSFGSKIGLTGFKLPLNYNKHKKAISKASPYSALVSELNEKSAQSADIKEFCKKLLLIKEFQSFKTVHFFKHEKGQSLAAKLEIENHSEKKKNLHVNEFNHLFQAIKKSKNRTFGQESLRGFNFDILGTFLAREFSLENHNIIFVVSRNDFLSQTKKEKDGFNRVMKVVAPYLNALLDRELEVRQFSNARLAYENLPHKVVISSKKEKGFQSLPSGRHFTLQMEDSLDKADIFHQERIALLGELLNTLKHELSNPLFGLQLSAELLRHDLKDEHREFMEEICSSIKRSQSIISNFTELYTSSETLKASDLQKLVKEVFTLTKSQSRHIEKRYETQGSADKDFVINANSVWLAQILFNLVVNSAQAMNQNKTEKPQILVKAIFSDPFQIHVIDNGPGATSQTIENMFKPFYTTKDKGTGLGLAISQSLASKLGGKIEYLHKGQGAHFVLRLGL